MNSLEILYCTIGMCIVSYLPRVLPPFVLAKVKISPFVERWLRYIPTSVFGALVFSEIFLKDGRLNIVAANINIWASLLVLIVAVKTHSLAKSIMTGLVAFWFLEKILF